MWLPEKKIGNYVPRKASTWWYMENVTSIISQGINSITVYTMVKKNTGDSSHQALTNFSFSELFCNRFSLK